MAFAPDIAWRGELDALRRRVNDVLPKPTNNFVHTIQIVHSNSVTRNDPVSRILSCEPEAYENAVMAFVGHHQAAGGASESYSQSLVGLDWDEDAFYYAEMGASAIHQPERELSFRPTHQQLWEYKGAASRDVKALANQWCDALSKAFSNRGSTMWVTQSHHQVENPSLFPTSSAFVVFNSSVPTRYRYTIAKTLRDFLVRILAEMYHEELGKAIKLNVSLLHEILNNPSTTRMLGTAIARQLKAFEKAIISPCAILVTGETGTGKMCVANKIHSIREQFFNRQSGFEELKDTKGPCVINVTELPTERAAIRSSIVEKMQWPAKMSREEMLQSRGIGVVIFDEFHLATPTAQDVIRQMYDAAFTTLPDHDAAWWPMRKPIFIALPGLSVAAATGRFNASLYAQISAFEIQCPPLHQRKDDLKDLLPEIVKALSAALRLEKEFQLSKEDLTAILDREWPGNFHELHGHLIRRMLYTGNAGN